MLCEEIMRRDVKCVDPDDTAQSAARVMLDENVGFLPVCEHGRVVGAVTDRDIAIRLVAGGLSCSARISDVMTKDILSCSPSDDVREAQKLMAEKRKSRIICLDDRGHLAGIISLSDLAKKESGLAAQILGEISSREAL